MGEGMARALHLAGWGVTLFSRRPRASGALPFAVVSDLALAVAGKEMILLAVPDDAIGAVAHALRPLPHSDPVVLHLAGARDRSALTELEGWGALGSFWPLQAIADPVKAPELLAGAYVALEGEPRAIAAGERMAAALRMTPFTVGSEAKVLLHAGAVLAANYSATLKGAAEQLAREAGLTPALAEAIYLPLIRGAEANIAARGRGAALTGPIRRGDVETVRRHLEVLTGEVRELYRVLGLETVGVAEGEGLDPARGAELRRLLAG